jgi:hypothetical protein
MEIIKLLIVVTNINIYASGNHSTGLWLSELTHIYEAAKAKEYEVTITSPDGGETPVDPERLKFFTLDKILKNIGVILLSGKCSGVPNV